jgi:lipoprotein NlpI
LKTGIRESPRFERSYFMLARNYNLNKDYDSEIAVLRQAAFIMPENAEVGKKLAVALDDQIDRMECYVADPYLVDDTIAVWQKVLPALPEDAEVHRKLLLKYELKGLFDLQLFEARTLYKLTGSPEDRLLLADSLVSAGYLQEGLDIYEALRKKDSGLPSLKMNMGTAYFYNHDLNAAAKLISAHIRDKPEDFYPRVFYFLIESSRGNGDKARSSLHDFVLEHANYYKGWTGELAGYVRGSRSERALIGTAKDPCQQTEAYYYVAMDHLRKGDLASASDYLKKLLDLKVYGYREYTGAAYALKSMEAASATP